MELSNQHNRRPPLKPSEVYRPRLGAQNPPRWKVAMAEQEAWRAISSPSICPAQTADADAEKSGD
jgi:hypothetical protein